MKDPYKISLTTTSNLRTEILICLNEGSTSLSDLRDRLNINSSTALHVLRKLERSKLTAQDQARDYVLTNIGKIVARKLVDFRDTLETLDKFESFWFEHDLSAIPDRLLERVDCLRDSRIVTGTPVDVFKAYHTVIKLLSSAKEVDVLSSIFIPDIKLLFDIPVVTKNARIVLTEEVLDPSISEVGRERVRQALATNLRLYMVRDNPKIGLFAVTDYFVGFVPYALDGTFNWSANLISCDKIAIDWGRELFDHYLEVSESVDLA